ncbi:unnamed protein product [Lupinus luteus]|uniref:Uncharacterized protein n=1 Tax=Lupinus luteus TaxID=3873 RepID=A0AAV1WXB5_LUPLU
MWNRLAPYVLKLFGRHGKSPVDPKILFGSKQEELFLLLDERKSQTAEERGKRLMLLPIAGNETDSQAESEAVLSSAEIKAGKGRSSQVRLPTPWVVNHIR